jgi:hypothetical protein
LWSITHFFQTAKETEFPFSHEIDCGTGENGISYSTIWLDIQMLTSAAKKGSIKIFTATDGDTSFNKGIAQLLFASSPETIVCCSCGRLREQSPGSNAFHQFVHRTTGFKTGI